MWSHWVLGSMHRVYLFKTFSVTLTTFQAQFFLDTFSSRCFNLWLIITSVELDLFIPHLLTMTLFQAGIKFLLLSAEFSPFVCVRANWPYWEFSAQTKNVKKYIPSGSKTVHTKKIPSWRVHKLTQTQTDEAVHFLFGSAYGHNWHFWYRVKQLWLCWWTGL